MARGSKHNRGKSLRPALYRFKTGPSYGRIRHQARRSKSRK